MGAALLIVVASMLGAPMAMVYGIALAIACLLVPSLYIVWLERPLMRKLRAHGFALCTGCGYPLEGRPTDTCPECGEATSTEAAIIAWRNLVKNREGFAIPTRVDSPQLDFHPLQPLRRSSCAYALWLWMLSKFSLLMAYQRTRSSLSSAMARSRTMSSTNLGLS